MATYSDKWISCTDSGIDVRAYYFPWGTKHIQYGSIKGVRRIQLGGVLRGNGRIWGTSNLKYWASLDPRRPSKSVAFILDLGKAVSPFLTPDDPDGFEQAVRAHTSIVPTESGGDGPLI